MGIFSCMRCGFMYEFIVANPYRKRITLRTDHCAKCNELSTFRFVTPTGQVGTMPHKPAGIPGPSNAALWWRKQRDGKKASEPLDCVCGPHEW
jgi:hypothetical protein